MIRENNAMGDGCLENREYRRTIRAYHIESVYMFSLLEFLTTNPPSLPCRETATVHTKTV